MGADAFGYAIGNALVVYVFFLIFLGLLALIHPLRERFALRNVLAWLVSSVCIVYLTGKGGGDISLAAVGSIFCAAPVALRYIKVTRKKQAASAG